GALDFLLDDFRQVANHELQRWRGALAGPESPGTQAEVRIGGNPNAAGHVPGIVLGLLRVGQRQQRALEPESGDAPQLVAGLDATAEHLEAALVVEEQAADP